MNFNDGEVMKKLTIGLFVLLTVIIPDVYAATVEDKIAGLYVAYFDRAGDESGLNYWKGQSQVMGEDSAIKILSEGFSSHPKFTALYDGLTDQQYVEKIYTNVLGQAGDSAGIAYWSGLLNTGTKRSDMVADFVSISLDFDKTAPQYTSLAQTDLDAAEKRKNLLSNKVTVSLNFVSELGSLTNLSNATDPNSSSSLDADSAYQASIAILSAVTDIDSTKTQALSDISLAKLNNTINGLLSANSGDTVTIPSGNYNLTVSGSYTTSIISLNIPAVTIKDLPAPSTGSVETAVKQSYGSAGTVTVTSVIDTDAQKKFTVAFSGTLEGLGSVNYDLTYDYIKQ